MSDLAIYAIQFGCGMMAGLALGLVLRARDRRRFYRSIRVALRVTPDHEKEEAAVFIDRFLQIIGGDVYHDVRQETFDELEQEGWTL